LRRKHEANGRFFSSSNVTASLENTKKYLTETLATLEAVKPEDVNGNEGKLTTATLGPNYEPEIKIINYVQTYLQPNVYFHVTTLYDILRSKGVVLGKGDLLRSYLRLEKA
jgi:uncharacterized protein